MDRRRFCAALLSGAAGGLSGCSDASTGGVERAAPDGATASPSANGSPTAGEAVDLARLGNPPDICEAGIVENFSIEAIVSPAFGPDWHGYDVDQKYAPSDGDEALPDETAVVGRAHDGRARAYPLPVLWHHEIVNDTFGVPLVVTYCSICRSGLVADRRLRGEPTRFGVTGQLWHPPDRYISASAKAGRAFGAGRWNASEGVRVRDGPNLVMYDELTRSYWSQAVGQAICGPMTDTRLSIVPSTLASWADWVAAHPDTAVLLPPPHSRVDG